MSNVVNSGYAQVNGLKMYYEIHGIGKPLVLIHGGGSTIEVTFGRILPSLVKNNKVIAMELQGHGHTEDIDRELSFNQDAADVVALLRQFKIEKADFFGFSNGGQTAMQIAINYPEIVNKLIIASAFFKKEGAYPWLFESLNKATHKDMPQPLKDAYLKVAPNPGDLNKMFERDAKRMIEFKDWQEEEIKSIKAPTLIMLGDNDIVRPEHAVEMFRLIPEAHLTILPGAHGGYIGEILAAKGNSKILDLTVDLINEFLDTEKYQAYTNKLKHN